MEVVITEGSDKFFDAVAHCPGVGHTPGAHMASHKYREHAVLHAVLGVLRHFWADGVPAVMVPPGAPQLLALREGHPGDTPASASPAR